MTKTIEELKQRAQEVAAQAKEFRFYYHNDPYDLVELIDDQQAKIEELEKGMKDWFREAQKAMRHVSDKESDHLFEMMEYINRIEELGRQAEQLSADVACANLNLFDICDLLRIPQTLDSSKIGEAIVKLKEQAND